MVRQEIIYLIPTPRPGETGKGGLSIEAGLEARYLITGTILDLFLPARFVILKLC